MYNLSVLTTHLSMIVPKVSPVSVQAPTESSYSFNHQLAEGCIHPDLGKRPDAATVCIRLYRSIPDLPDLPPHAPPRAVVVTTTKHHPPRAIPLPHRHGSRRCYHHQATIPSFISTMATTPQPLSSPPSHTEPSSPRRPTTASAATITTAAATTAAVPFPLHPFILPWIITPLVKNV
ncbi:hypothetical protein Tco_0759443 [Tanacetum coccineum]